MPNKKKTDDEERWGDNDLEGEIILIKDDRRKTLFRLRKILETKMQQLEVVCFLLRGVGQQLDNWERDEKILFRKKDCWFLMQTLMHFSMQREHLDLLQKEWTIRFEVKTKQ